MAKAKAIIKRRRAVQNTRKITRTMQLIATARFQRAHSRAVNAKPYTDKIAELVGNLSQAADLQHPLLEQRTDTGRSILLTITANRGLCGGYNGSVLEQMRQYYRARESRDKVDLYMVGKKGLGYARFAGYEVYKPLMLPDEPGYDDVRQIATEMMDRFTAGEVDSVHVAYMRFISAGTQRAEVLELLPLKADDLAADQEDEHAGTDGRVQYDFTPEPAELLENLLPAAVMVRLFQCFNDAVVSEQVARMTAMKAATDNADQLIKSLSQQYNRARQTQITNELSEIVAGADALG